MPSFRKYLLPALFTLAIFTSCKKNNESLQVSTNTTPPPIFTPTQGTSWSLVHSTTTGAFLSLEPYNGSLYVGGGFSYLNSAASFLGHTDGSVFTPDNFGLNNGTGIYTLDNYAGDLMMGGDFVFNTGHNCCARWNGSTFIGNLYNQTDRVSAMIDYNGSLVVGGRFTGNCNYVAMHNGSTYQPMGNGFSDQVNDLIIYNNELYACGSFIYSGSNPVNYIAKWNGSAWVPLGSGLNGRANCMAVYNGELYVGGFFSQAGGNPAGNIARWNGTSWSNVGGGVTVGSDCVKCMLVCDGKLVVAGGIAVANNTAVKSIALWEPSTGWSNMAGGMNSYYYIINDIALYNNHIYVAVNYYYSPTQGYLYRLD